MNLKNDQKVLILKIGPDGNLHQVQYDDNRYYKRIGTITITMESSDIEAFFDGDSSNSRKKTVDTIVDDYYSKLKNDMGKKPICTLIVIPEVTSYKLDLSNLPDNFPVKFQPICCSGWDHGVTGRTAYTFGYFDNEDLPYAVTEITEFGEIKAYNSFMLENRYTNFPLPKSCSGYVPSTAYEKYLIKALHLYLLSLEELGVSGSFFINIALLNIKGYILATKPMFESGRIFKKQDIRPDIKRLSGDTKITSLQDVAKVLKPMFDYVWREFGCERSYNYTKTGKWQGE